MTPSRTLIPEWGSPNRLYLLNEFERRDAYEQYWSNLDETEKGFMKEWQESGAYDHLTSDGAAVEPANDTASVSLGLADGGDVSVTLSEVSELGDRVQEMHAAFWGADGTLELDFDATNGFHIDGIRQGEQAFTELHVPQDLRGGIEEECDGFELLPRVFTEHSAGCRAFIDAILEDRDLSPSFPDGMKAQRIVSV